MEKPEYKKHKSWGSLQISRVSGHVNLYGSHVTHQHFIEMRILASERKHDLGQDWYYAGGEPYIVVQMSSAQFAEAITSLNTSLPGTPCTIRYFNGEDFPRPPAEESEGERSKEYMKVSVAESQEDIEACQKKIAEILAKPAIGKKDREVVSGLVSSIAHAVKNNIPFYVEQFQEATERVTAKAKTEFDSMMAHHIQCLGLDTLEKLKDLKTLDAGHK